MKELIFRVVVEESLKLFFSLVVFLVKRKFRKRKKRK